MQKAAQQPQPATQTRSVQELQPVRHANFGAYRARGYAGNQATLRRVSQTAPRLQCKLQIGAVNDPLETEADRVADEVMGMPAASRSLSPASPPETNPMGVRMGALHRKCAACEEEELNRKEAGNGGSLDNAAAPPIVQDVLRSPGQALDESTRAFFEPRFGRDFRHVRVHAGERADRSARSINARAYTVGRDIAFGRGEFAPHSEAGRRLLAHELAHVVQQGSANTTDGAAGAAHVSRAGEIIRREVHDCAPAPPAELDKQYQDALQTAIQTGYWETAAQKLNQYNYVDASTRLADLTSEQIGYMYQGALDNNCVGPDSAVAQWTKPGAPAASRLPPPAPAAPPAAAPAPPAQTQPAAAPAAPAPANQAARNRQVACVIRLGGCAGGPYARDGGTPTDSIPGYNKDCREKEGTQYNGPDVTPTDEECKNPPQAPPAAAALGSDWTTGEKVSITILAVVGTALVVGAGVLLVAGSGGTLAPVALAVITALAPVAETAGGAALGEAALGATITLEVTGTGAAAAAAVSAPVVATGTLGATSVAAAGVAAAPAVAPAVATIAVAETSSAAAATAAALGIGSSLTLKSDQPSPKDDKDDDPSCIVGPYNRVKCLPGEQAHHIVADYTLRYGTRAEGIAGQKRIPGFPSFNDGPAMCLKGHRTVEGDEHNIAHEADAAIEALGAAGTPKGTAPIAAITAISIRGASNARNCPKIIAAGIGQQPSLLGTTRARTTILPPGDSVAKTLRRCLIG